MRIAYFADPNCNHGSRWINHFAEANHVVLFCVAGQRSYPLLSSQVVKYPILPAQYPLRRLPSLWRTTRQLRLIAAEQGIELVHSMYAVPYAFWAQRLGLPNHIVTTRGSDVLVEYRLKFRGPANGPWGRWTNRLLRRLFERALCGARCVTSTSRGQQRVLAEFVADRSRLHLIRTGVDVQGFDAVYDGLRRRLPEEELSVFCPRMIKPLYNIDRIVAGFALVCEERHGRATRLRLIDYGSDPAYLASVRRQISSLRLEGRVEILPEQDRTGLLQLYRDADLVVMVPDSDGTPVTGVESMLARRPLLLGSAEYDPELFNPGTVWALDAVTPETIARGILGVVSAPEAEREARTARARAAAQERADLGGGLRALERLYRGLPPEAADRACLRCVMSTADDPGIEFDAAGVCSYCHEYERARDASLVSGEAGRRRLHGLVAEIRRAGRGQRYDCVAGVSGGVDSTYACYLARQLGLRPLVVHLDNSWNTELAVQNIENLVTRLGLDLRTFVIDWEEFRDLQIAFLKASVIDTELLTDHAIGAALLKTAARIGVRYVVSGTNLATEAVLPRHWYHLKTDWLNIRDIHRRFGRVPLRTFPHAGYFERLWLTRVRGIRTVPILDYVDYDRAEAKRVVSEALGWRDYGGKHHESFFTRFFQTYILPRKFGVDKRRAHLSNLICAGQLSREAALAELGREAAPEQLERDKEYVLKKLRLSGEEFDALMALPARAHTDYASYCGRHLRYEARVLEALRPLRRLLRPEARAER